MDAEHRRGIEIGVARPQDLDAAGRVCVAAYRPSGMAADDPYFEALADTTGRSLVADVLVARDGNDILGCVTWCPQGSPLREVSEPGEGEFRMLAVSPSAQGRGIGRALVDACLQRARADQLHSVVLSSATWMTTAHRLYERMGFVRATELDWKPRPDIALVGYRIRLDR